MAKKITIIGAGPGGYVAAIRAAQLGAEVTVIEQDNVGGTCLNWGCIPSKIMKTTAEMLENFHRADEFGITIDESARLNMERLLARKQSIIKTQSTGILGLFKKHKIRYLNGRGQIRSPKLTTVIPAEGEAADVPSDSLIIASGSRPLNIPAFPFDGKRIISSNDALSLKEIPKSLLIVGGGVVGCEFAFIFASFGSQVTVVEALPRILPLPSVDEDCSVIIQREMKKRNIKFMINRTVDRVEENGETVRVTIAPSPFAQGLKEKDMIPVTADVEKVLVCIGRQPNTDNISIENTGVKLNEKGWIPVNTRMETNIPDVFAIGDVLGPANVMLAHVASHEGLVAAENLMGENRVMHYNVIPGVIFTMPEVANVGLTEAQAKAQGFNTRSDSVLFRALGKAHVMGELAGQTKLVSDADTGRLLGVHIVGPHAADLIAEGSVVIQMGGTVKDLAETIHAHPTLSEIMSETAFKVMERGIHC